MVDVIIKVNGQGVNFKIDTGAEVSVITERTMDSLKLNRKLSRETTKQLMGANKTQLEVICEFVACLEYNGRKAEQPIYVVKKLQNDLLGLPAIKALNLLTSKRVWMIKGELTKSTVLSLYDLNAQTKIRAPMGWVRFYYEAGCIFEVFNRD